MAKGGQKGVQRPVLSPGTLAPIHPIAFLVITKPRVFGIPVSDEYRWVAIKQGGLTFQAFGLQEIQLDVTRISPKPCEGGKVMDMVGIVTTQEGEPLPAGAIASRLGAFADVEEMEKKGGATDAQLMSLILGSKNNLHNNYQDFQKFMDAGGKIGLQHDPLLYGAYNLNPFLVRVEQVPMLVVEQGQVAVIKAYVGLPTQDTSGAGFKFGSLVRPGHQGIWQEPLRTGKYPINPRIYDAEVVLTAILKLDWAKEVTGAHSLDAELEPIIAKSNEGFVFSIDLAGADSRSRHQGPARDLDGGVHGEPGERGAAGGGGQPLPRQDRRHGSHQVYPDAPGGSGGGIRLHPKEARRV